MKFCMIDHQIQSVDMMFKFQEMHEYEHKIIIYFFDRNK